MIQSTDIGVQPGTYALVLRLPVTVSIPVGRLGRIHFSSGWYLYVGSAFGPGGVKARCAHHQKITNRPRWHIDYLRAHARLAEVWLTHDEQRREHLWAGLLSRMSGLIEPVTGFGASDCGCTSHLFYQSDKPDWRAFRQRVKAQLFAHAAIKCKDLLN